MKTLSRLRLKFYHCPRPGGPFFSTTKGGSGTRYIWIGPIHFHYNFRL